MVQWRDMAWQALTWRGPVGLDLVGSREVWQGVARIRFVVDRAWACSGQASVGRVKEGLGEVWSG